MSHVLGPRLDAVTVRDERDAERADGWALPGLPSVPPEVVGPLRLAELGALLEAGAEEGGAEGEAACARLGGCAGFLASLRVRLEHLRLLEDAYPADVPEVRARLRAAAADCLAEGADAAERRRVDALFGAAAESATPGADSATVELGDESDAGGEGAARVRARRCGAKACVDVSFGCNVGLCGAKIVAYALSGSMSLLASMVDSCLDILSGLVLFVCARLARSGQRSREARGRCARCCLRCHRGGVGGTSDAYPLGKKRYETLGVLSFSCIMGTFALTLAYESVLKIIELARAPPEAPTRYGPLQMGVIGATILLKLALCVACHVCGRRAAKAARGEGGGGDEKDAGAVDAVMAYRDDHRNDVLSNAAGFVAGFVGSAYHGQDGRPNLSYVDPVGSLLLSCYILVNWTGAALGQIRLLAGKAVGPDELGRVVLHAMHFDPRIERVNRALAYRCGRDSTVELSVCLPDALPIVDCHRLVHALSDAVEALDGVERCYVHVESEDCVNPPR
ncbi:Cation efflux family protein [Giardia muris]|uniref:Cation efflux family protein n=1 Tax=Giardia muris TaxID=5742 RepID=A0A4Z1SPQ6_GIAMU|nr:Cation efflux family protein [Giardia muris]|eukprot:TNJ26855.1 Cation efflux family protein [Giardia muris]